MLCIRGLCMHPQVVRLGSTGNVTVSTTKRGCDVPSTRLPTAAGPLRLFAARLALRSADLPRPVGADWAGGDVGLFRQLTSERLNDKGAKEGGRRSIVSAALLKALKDRLLSEVRSPVSKDTPLNFLF